MHKDYQALFEKNRAVFEEFALRVKTKLVSQPFVFPHSALKAIELGRELEQLVLETIKDIKEAGPNDKAEIYQIIRKEFGRLEFIHGEKAQAYRACVSILSQPPEDLARPGIATAAQNDAIIMENFLSCLTDAFAEKEKIEEKYQNDRELIWSEERKISDEKKSLEDLGVSLFPLFEPNEYQEKMTEIAAREKALIDASKKLTADYRENSKRLYDPSEKLIPRKKKNGLVIQAERKIIQVYKKLKIAQQKAQLANNDGRLKELQVIADALEKSGGITEKKRDELIEKIKGWVSEEDTHAKIPLTDLRYATQISTGNELRNINSFEYLKIIADTVFPPANRALGIVAPILPPDSPVAAIILKEFQNHNPTYRSSTAYGDLYSNFLLALESACEDKKANKDPLLDAIVRAAFENENKALERTAEMTKGVLSAIKHTSEKAEKAVTKHLDGPDSFVVKLLSPKKSGDNLLSPQEADSAGFKMGPMAAAMTISETKKTSTLGKAVRKKAKKGVFDFKPMTTTSQVSVRKYNHQTAASPKELRMGTQAQYHQGRARMNPLFERRLRTQLTERNEPCKEEIAAKKAEFINIIAASEMPMGQPFEETEDIIRKKEGEIAKLEYPITHVYLNNLGLDAKGLSFKGRLERRFESDLTRELHTAELNNPNLAVITLPADKGFLDKKLLITKKSESCSGAFKKFLAVANGTSKEDIQDFFISDKVQKLLYGKDQRGYINEAKRKEILTTLLNNSFKKVLGVNNPETSTLQFSQAELQAVYFHFIKFELTNYILDTLEPDTFNTSCKDGIDRGGVSSAYYNLIKSIESEKPLSKEEFYRALHAAPTLVKGRAMNHHSKLIWNAVDKYLGGNDKLPDNDPAKKQIPEWLVTWRNENVPEKMVATCHKGAFNNVKTFCQSLYTPKKAESSSFFVDVSRIEPSFNGKKCHKISEKTSEEVKEALIRDFVKTNLTIPNSHPVKTVSDETVSNLIQCYNQMLRDAVNPILFVQPTGEILQIPATLIINQFSLISGKNPVESFSVNAQGDVILTIQVQQFITPQGTSSNLDLNLGTTTYEYKLNEKTNPPSFQLADFKCDNRNLERALANPSDETHIAELLRDAVDSAPALTVARELTDKEIQYIKDRQSMIRDYIKACNELNVPPNLTGLNCTGVDLTGLNLSGAKLTGAILTGITFDKTTQWKGITEFKDVTCDEFQFNREGLKHTTKTFVGAFKDIYAPSRSPTLFRGEKDTEVTRFINNKDTTDGSKLVYLLSHAEEKTRFFRHENNTRLAIDKVIGGEVVFNKQVNNKSN